MRSDKIPLPHRFPLILLGSRLCLRSAVLGVNASSQQRDEGETSREATAKAQGFGSWITGNTNTAVFPVLGSGLLYTTNRQERV